MDDSFKAEAHVGGDGSVTLRGVPFAPGARVEVTVRPTPVGARDVYSLRGLPLRYDGPDEPVAEDDWDVLS